MTKNNKLLELVLEYQKTKSVIILNQIIKLNERLITWYLENTKLKISREDLYNLIIKGLEYSISMFDQGKSDNIISYISLGIKRILYTQQIYIESDNDRLFASFLDYKEIIEAKYGITLDKDFSIFDDIIDLMIEESIIRKESKEEVKKILIELLRDYYGSIKIINSPISNEVLNSNVELPIDSNYIQRLLKGTLTEKEYDYIVSYFGLFGNPDHSLEELGQKEHVSRENISQIKNKALEKLKYIFAFYSKSEFKLDIDKFKSLLQKILSEKEYLYLTSFYGLFGNDKKSYQQLENIYHKRTFQISALVNQAIAKIFFYIEYQDIKFPYSEEELKNILKTNLSDYEYKTFVTVHGLFGIKKETKEEYARINNLSLESVKDALIRVNSRIKNIVRNDKVILEFLQTILSKEEFTYLSLRYGLQNNTTYDNKSIGKMFNQNPQEVNRLVNLSIEKIKIKLRHIDIDINKSLVQEVLKTLLTEEEYEYICQTYGIFGYQRVNRDSIIENESEKKLARTNIKSFTRVAALLNIESKER